MIFTREHYEIMSRVDANYPGFKEMLETWLDNELVKLPDVGVDQVQKYQGRCQILQELLEQFDVAPDVMAKRMVAQPYTQ